MLKAKTSLQWQPKQNSFLRQRRAIETLHLGSKRCQNIATEVKMRSCIAMILL